MTLLLIKFLTANSKA